jgi:hypothetical protein
MNEDKKAKRIITRFYMENNAGKWEWVWIWMSDEKWWWMRRIEDECRLMWMKRISDNEWKWIRTSRDECGRNVCQGSKEGG